MYLYILFLFNFYNIVKIRCRNVVLREQQHQLLLESHEPLSDLREYFRAKLVLF